MSTPRVLIVMRGIPGSGKTTQALAAQEDTEDTYKTRTVICSADYFFETSGDYTFDASKLRQAHESCLNDFKNCVADKQIEHIIIDNTNTKIWEFQKYIDYVKGRNFTVRVLRMETPLDVCQKRCVHGVPYDKIQQMRDRFEDYPGEEIIGA